jgi:hypothetical protein
MTVGLMTLINKYIEGVRATAISVGGQMPIIRQLDSGDMLFGIATAAKIAEAYEGGGPSFENPMKINVVSSTYGTWAYMMTLDKNIKTLYDLKGKRVTLGKPGQGTTLVGEAVLKGIGLEKDADYTGIMVPGKEGAEALIDGTVDAVFITGSKAQADVLLLTSTKDVYFIPFPEDKMDAMAGFMGEFGVSRPIAVLPANTYRGQVEPYKTFVTPSSFIVQEGADIDFVYEVTKVLWENIEELGKIHEAGKEFNLDDLKLNFGAPYHPGAFKYYKEIGALAEDPFLAAGGTPHAGYQG